MILDTRQAVFKFVASELGVSKSSLQDTTTLLGDLGVDADDGGEFLLEFPRLFEVDTSNLDLSQHFGPEGLPIWFPVYWIVLALRKGTAEERARHKPISIGMLISAAHNGKWPSAA